MKRLGSDEPAQHHSISGGNPLFQTVVLEMISGLEDGSVRSALR